jgi:NCS1 family nucleobase:cation symporter-1
MADPQLINHDLAPTDPAQRTWSWRAFAALWVGMVVCLPTYSLAGGLVSTGLSAWQAVGLVFLGNLVVLVPMLIVGHAGAKFGLPFPVLLRSAFGPRGAQLPALARALVACGWFGINTWLGGSALYTALNILTHDALAGPTLPLLAINLAQLACFLAFWALHIWFILKGTESIRWLETWSAPFLLAMALLLLAWAWRKAGGLGPMLSAPASLHGPELLGALAGGLTAMVGFWATMALNICDFTRFARSQRDQVLGQSIGLPIPMALFAFIGVAVTSATVAIYGRPIWNPIELAQQMGGFGVVLALFVLLIATLTTNLAANVVSPAYDFSNLAPSRISFAQGGLITAGLGVAIFPWRLLESAGTYLFAWLGGYGALLGPIAGILVCDYLWVRRGQYEVGELFKLDGRYRGVQGWNLAGVAALVIGVAPNLPGFLHTVGLATPPAIFDSLFQWAWFIGFGLAALIYGILMRGARQSTSGS